DHTAQPDAKRELQRANKEAGGRMKGGLIGGEFQANQSPSHQAERIEVFDRLWASFQTSLAAKPQQAISVSLPDGSVKSGTAFKTTPMEIALGISQGLADSVIVARVAYKSRLEEDKIVACDEDEEAQAQKNGHADGTSGEGELWDMNRPLVGDCLLTLLKFDDPEAKVRRIS
ncbi:hypothetical protein B484DRAFT_407480, partial [Ochromonadaceae sp. CCMP2298]